MRAREMLNKIKWHPDYDEGEYSVTYRHRGAQHDELTISFCAIEGLCTSDFVILDRDGLEVYIPYHRVLRVTDSKGEVVWRKRGT